MTMMVNVKIAENLYQMREKEAEKLIELASGYVPQGLYGIRKKDYIELLNRPMSRTQIKEARRHYKKLGFKVYANG